MAMFSDFAEDWYVRAFQTWPGTDPTVVTATSTEVVLRNPYWQSLIVLTGTGLQTVTLDGRLSVEGTLTGFEVHVRYGNDSSKLALEATGISWTAASLIAVGQSYAETGDTAGISALLSLQPVTWNAGDVVRRINFSFEGITSDLTLTGSDLGDTLRGGQGYDTIRGGDGDDEIWSGSDAGGDLIDTGSGADIVYFFGRTGNSDDGRPILSHRSLEDQTGIVATLSDRGNSMIDKGVFGQTRLFGLRDMVAQGGGLTVEGTSLDDRFDITFGGGISASRGGVFDITAGQGNDTIVAAGNGLVGLDFATDSNGIAATQGAVVNLPTGIVANDGFGFVDTLSFGTGIDVSVTLTEWADTLGAVGRSGTLLGGGGIDTLDYGQGAFSNGVHVDLGAGQAGESYFNIVWGVGFIQHIEGFENLIGTRDNNDHLSGTQGANLIEGLGGYDVIYGDGFRAGYAPEQAAQVWRLWQAALNRAPDAVEQNALTQQMVPGEWGASDRLRMAADVLGKSAEFQSIHGSLDDTAFVTSLYENLLGRAPDADGMRTWLSFLSWAGPAQVALGFAGSREFIRRTLAEANGFAGTRNEANWTDDLFRLYQATLDRAPDAAGFVDWIGRLGGGTTYPAAVAGFTGSREFQNTYGALNDKGFVTLLYGNVLDRAPDAGGLSDWLDRLASGTTRAEVVAGFAQSREFVNDTAAAATDFVRNLGGGDTIEGGAGQNVLWGGMLADEFVFDADTPAQDRVMDFEGWDFLTFRDFGYDDAFDIRRHMTQSGADVVFEDQGVTVTLVNTQLAGITDDSLIFA